MVRSLGVGALAVAVGLVTVAGCAELFGIDDRPLVRDAAIEIATVDANDDGGADAGCVVGTTFCTSFCPRPDFCEAFDEPEPEKRWNKGPVLSGGTLGVEDDRAHGGSGTALFARVTVDGGGDASADDTEGKGGGAFLVHGLDVGATPARGLRALFRVRLDELKLDAVTYPDASLPGPAVVIGGFADPSGSGLGLTSWYDQRRGVQVGFVYREPGVLAKASRPLLRFPTTAGTLAALHDGYTTVDVALGPASVLAAQGLDCDGVDASAPLALRGSILLTGCVEAPELANATWFQRPFVTAGALLNGTGSVAIAIDGVAVFVLR